MSRKKIVLICVLALTFAGAGWWIAQSMAPHKHELVQKTDEQGKVYYTCAMHPQVKQDEPGNCPICGMKLVKREEGAGPAKGDVLYWHDPMRPEVHFDKPGKSPFMDMELVPKYASEGGTDAVQIDSGMAQNLGIRTVQVQRGDFSQRVEAVGGVEVDERRIVVVESRATGWVEQLLVRAVGDPVRRGQRVAGVYSPDLFAAQQELVLAAKSNDLALLAASRQRLVFLGMGESQIEAVLTSREAQRQTAVVAAGNGVVTELNVREGQQVAPGTPLMRIADLSRVWITVEIPEAQGAWIREGREAEAHLAALPGKVFRGKVEYIYPRLDPQTRTVRARLSFDNPGLQLKPGMYADVSLFGRTRQGTLLVPTEAVIRTGERSVVILAEDDGRFRPANVKVGDDRQGQTEILEGLREGESVVVSGQFLIDSEANLRSVLGRLSSEDAEQSGMDEAKP
ncbi:MAG: efflux RND transporter periplasmic adaptor subunit [Burkholderiales bacterium]